jgi:hypothetical protein
MAFSLTEYAATIQDPLRQGVVETLWGESTMMKLINFISFKGVAYPYTKRSKRPSVSTRSLNGSFAETTGVYSPDVEMLSVIGGKVKTDTILMDIKPQSRQINIAAQLESAALMFDRLFFQGDPSASGHANEFFGLKARVTAGQTLNCGTNGGAITHQIMSKALDKVKGANSTKTIFLSRTARRDLSEDVKAAAGGKGVFDVFTQLTSYDGAKIQEIEKDELDNEILPYTETQGSSNLTASAYVARLGGKNDEKDLQGIMGTEIQAQPVGNFGEYYLDIVQALMGIGIFGPFAVARINGILAQS